ncbi:MAG: GDP-mannose 4,6-dehydratase [Myxococcota bacterium]
MRIWVSGAAGFVGSRLRPRLEAAGHTVIGVDREVEITDPEAVRESLTSARPDAILHLAAQSSSTRSAAAPERAAQINYGGTANVLQLAREHHSQCRVVLVSSSEIYGSRSPGAEPFRETDGLAPRTPYARTKAAADLLAARYAADGLDVVRARPFNHTGPGQSPDAFVVPSFARQVAQIASGERPAALQVGNLASVRDFLDVDDVIEAYLRLLDRDVPPGAYNIASGQGRRIGDLLDDLIALAETEATIEVDPERFRPTDDSVGDASKLRAATGWEPKIPWRDTLSRVLESVASTEAPPT